MICLTTTERTLTSALKQVERNKAYIDMVELRLDLLDEDELASAQIFPRLCALPTIATFRRVSDGGKSQLSDKIRMTKLREIVLQGDFSYVDIEEDVKKSDLKIKREDDLPRYDFENELKLKGIKIIRSFHDMEKLPSNLFSLASKIAKKGDIPKIAVTPNTIVDVVTLFRMNEELKDIKEKIIIGMGDYGVCTRILYKKVGSMLTFASEDEIAPGQLSAKTLKLLYRADQVNARTNVYGIIGNPVLHTSSPLIHNPGFDAIHYNAIYVPFLVDKVRAFFKLAELIRIHGFSVTVPHKRDVLPYLGKITREVKQIGACNTVTRIQGMWKGTNTDYYGFLSPIETAISKGEIKSALIIGAGGAARAVAWALRNHHVKVTIANRTLSKAKLLASETMSNYIELEKIKTLQDSVDLVVQTTVVGMSPNDNEDILEDFEFVKPCFVYDLVYKPKYTKLLKRAQESGCTVINGSTMLLEQGKLQFESFTGYHFPHWVEVEL
ncbi:MAG: shikimate dehydrogenase [Sphaerochaetaceae bacterium]|nr:shikimate dehydrogenase [Sphaerochaetaceae bacterium]MDC7236419.1 shikimate dehydrogenase [Sphaerochaetaceae bacterium]MDC7242705.1 shikimate dehydrogenase [Sphaerochaetaceae bacterium]MDC7248400.1 shikimate dehydrogenase [Sphaerochaetaceae bacterium]